MKIWHASPWIKKIYTKGWKQRALECLLFQNILHLKKYLMKFVNMDRCHSPKLMKQWVGFSSRVRVAFCFDCWRKWMKLKPWRGRWREEKQKKRSLESKPYCMLNCNHRNLQHGLWWTSLIPQTMQTQHQRLRPEPD